MAAIRRISVIEYLQDIHTYFIETNECDKLTSKSCFYNALGVSGTNDVKPNPPNLTNRFQLLVVAGFVLSASQASQFRQIS
jgi:hypothetical protein